MAELQAKSAGHQLICWRRAGGWDEILVDKGKEP